MKKHLLTSLGTNFSEMPRKQKYIALVVFLHRTESVKSEGTGEVKSTDTTPGESP